MRDDATVKEALVGIYKLLHGFTTVRPYPGRPYVPYGWPYRGPPPSSYIPGIMQGARGGRHVPVAGRRLGGARGHHASCNAEAREPAWRR